ncbi:hypothetical protein PAPYR_11984 [Paratrimastix pyriformis]|uniref:Uncharacterized protein n=1 Tax=Paratrimastix pyriformis TaxID=342808 RepID=A0ABQ8U2P9_9EUKA|nr:hypothetical protein PAPYR_11984 [Paratrimastix pyriformis]
MSPKMRRRVLRNWSYRPHGRVLYFDHTHQVVHPSWRVSSVIANNQKGAAPTAALTPPGAPTGGAREERPRDIRVGLAAVPLEWHYSLLPGHRDMRWNTHCFGTKDACLRYPPDHDVTFWANQFDTLLIRPHGAHSTCQQPMLDRLANQFDTLFYRPHGPCWAHQQTFSYRLTNQFDTLFYRPHGPCWAHQQTFHTRISEMQCWESLLPMSDTADPLSVFGSGLPEGKPPTSARTKAGGPMSTTIPVDPGADSWPRMICGHTGAVSAAQLAGFYNDAHCELLPHVLLSTHWPVIFSTA